MPASNQHASGSTSPDTADGLRDLVHRAQGGDSGALSCLVEQHQAALRRFCRRLLHNPASAQDLAQETLVRALQALPLLEDPNRFSGWLHGIALNLARIWWRRQSREPLSLDLLSQDGDNALGHSDRAGEGRGTRTSHLVVLGPEEMVVEAERTEQVRRAVASLPPVLGQTVALHYLDGYSCAEIAGALRVPVSTVKTRLFKSRGRLRLVLTPQDGTDTTQLPGNSRGRAAKPMAPSAPRPRPSHDARTAAQTKAQKGTTPMVTTHEPAEGKSQDAGTAQSQSATRLPQNVLHCSFCLSPHEQVERLIAGPGQVYICNRCVAKCNDILRREGVPL